MKKLDKIYFITGITPRRIKDYGNKLYRDYLLPQHDNNPEAWHFGMRTFLWVPTYQKAEEIVFQNIADISEGGTCKWMVIEGLEPTWVNYKADPQTFFKYVGDWETDGHYECIKGWPKQLEEYYDKNHILKIITTIG